MYIVKPDSTPFSIFLHLSLISLTRGKKEVIYANMLYPISAFPAFSLSHLYPSPHLFLQNSLKVPFALLGKTQNLFSLLSEVGLAAVANNVLKEDRLPRLLVLLSLSGLFSLSLFEGDLDLGCLGVLLGENGLGDATP
jgi:hypothetical protein